MSVSASFDLRVVRSSGKELASQIEIIKALANYGWSFFRGEYVCYLPYGDNDNFNWTAEIISFESFLKILEQKEKRSELIGVSMTWKNSNIDGELLIWGAEEARKNKIHTPISFNMAANRKRFISQNNYEITDVNWYMEKLLPALNQNGMYVEYFSYEEYD